MPTSQRRNPAHRLLAALQKLACACFPLSALACASIPSEYLGNLVDASGRVLMQHRTQAGLVISGQEIARYASRHFGLVEVTLENRSRDWVRIQRLALDFGETVGNARVSLTEGADIDAWYEATLQRNDIRDTNEAAALGALLLLGETAGVVGVASGQREVAAVGGSVAAAAMTLAVTRAYNANIQDAERVRPLPSSHLLATPFAIPPGLFAKKWLLLNTRDPATPCVRALLMDYDVEGSGRERVLLWFRMPHDASEWQRDACRG